MSTVATGTTWVRLVRSFPTQDQWRKMTAWDRRRCMAIAGRDFEDRFERRGDPTVNAYRATLRAFTARMLREVHEAKQARTTSLNALRAFVDKLLGRVREVLSLMTIPPAAWERVERFAAPPSLPRTQYPAVQTLGS